MSRKGHVRDTTAYVARDTAVINGSVGNDDRIGMLVREIADISLGVTHDMPVIQGLDIGQGQVSLVGTIIHVYGISCDTAQIDRAQRGDVDGALHGNTLQGLVGRLTDIQARVRRTAHACRTDGRMIDDDVLKVALRLSRRAADVKAEAGININGRRNVTIREQTVGVVTHGTAHADLTFNGSADEHIHGHRQILKATEQHTCDTADIFAAGNIQGA